MQNTEDRKWLYEQLKDNGYDIGSQEEFEASLDNNEEDAKWYHEQATSLGLEVGNYEDFGSLFRNKPAPEGYTLEEMKATTATPMSEQYSVAPEPSKGQEKFGLDSGIPSITETAKGMVDGRLKMVEKPVRQEQTQAQPVEPLTKLGEGLVQGANNMVAGAKYDIAETIIKPVVGTQQDDFGALGRIAQIEAEGKDVAEETKWDAKKAIAPKLATATSLLSKFSPKYDTENPNIEIAGADSYDAEEYARRENEAQYDKVIRKALDEANGDVEKAKLIIATQAGKETHADVLQKAAVKKMAESKPTKGWAWVGEMIPQMVLPATGMALTGVTGIPYFAQVLGGVNMGMLTASTAGQAMADARQAGASNSQVWTSGIINGAVELLTEKIPYNRYVGRITDAAKSGAKQALGKAVTEVGSTANKELKDLLSKANKRLDGKLFSGKNIEDYMGDLVAEGISEATAEGLQTIIPIIYENPENYPTFMEILGNALEGAKGGIFMGAFLGGASKTAEHRMNRARRKSQGYVDVAEVTTPDGKDEIVEVVRNEQDHPVFYWNGQEIPILDKDVKQRHQFNFEDFERGQFQLEQDEAYENGRTLETQQEMNDAANMLELQAQEVRRLYGLGEDADIDAFLGENPLQKALDIRKTDEEAGQIILDYLNAKSTVDGVVEGAQDRIEEETLKATAIIDSRKSETDGLIHPAKMKVDDRQVYVISGNIALSDDGTINSADSDESIIVMDAATGKREFTTAKDLLSADAALDPEVEKQNVRATISDTISTEVANKLEGVLPFNIGDTYSVMDNDGNAHNVQVVAVDDQNTVQVIMDNEAQPTTVTKDIIQQMSNAYNLNRAAQFEQGRQEEREAEKMKQEAEQVVEPTNMVEQTTEVPAEVVPERVVPTLKDGNPDFNAMDAEMFVDEYVSRYGEDSATKIARKNISNARENISKIDKKIDDITDPNQMEGLYSQRNALEAQIARYSEILDRLGASEDANESEADQRNRLRNDAGNRITTLFPDGMPNVESFILADIATGNRIRWSDKVTNGIVTSRGLGAELGLSDSKQERTRRLPLIGKDAMTPEEYAESLRERLDAVGIRYDESSLRDAVLGVYQSVDSRKGAWDALENMSKKMQEPQTDMDWEDMQQQMVYNKAQNDNAPALPDMPDLETIEEEVPISGEEAAEIEAQEQTEDYKLSDEVDENGRQFVLASNGNIVFGNIDEESGLTPAPILLSEGIITNPATNDGYGLVHIEARHGDQIRNAGYPSVVSFIEEVAKNYQIIKEGKNRNGNNTYMLQLTDKHNNTLMVELSGDGTYWNINTAGIFKTSYGKNRKEVYNRQTTAKQPAEVVETSQSVESNGTQTPSSLIDVSTPKSSESKDTTSKPQKQEVDEKISQEEQKVNVNPTDGQKEAGNYKKGHVVVDGFNITIEQPKGSVRSGVDADGKEWSITMNNTYGYIRGTEGVDGDHIDVFLSDNLDNWGGEVFVVDQINTDGSFDEHKVMYGFNSIEEAQQAYLSNYSEGWQGLGAITGVSKDEFKKWIASSHRKTKPFAEYKSVKATEGQAVNTTDSANFIEEITATEPNAEGTLANKPKSDKKIEDFGEKIGGARKDIARARLLDTVKLSAKDLESLKDPDKILSRKAIIKYMEEGQMTQNDGISLLALNMATRGKYRKALTMEKYREVALQWERGEDIDVGITEQDIDKYMANMPEVARVKPNARERAIADLERIIMTPYNDYRDTYIALNYPAEYRNLRGTYIYKTTWNDKVVVVSGIDSRRGFVFSTYEQAVAKIKRDFPIVELEKSKAKNAAKDKEDSEGHLNITKDDMGWYRVKSRSIPGNIYLSGRFRTKKDAEAYLEQNKDMLLEREQKMTESLMGSNIGMVEREGMDYRNGQDVTPDDFLNTFAFRGVEFGNWVPQAERQLYLNKTYDAIMDFCNIIGISPKAFSLGGELALAFGARGKSRALAHYEPLKMVINLTRMKGAGSLAHEWFHAFDNYISKRKTGNISDMATARFAAERDEVSRAFYNLVSKMNSMDYTKRSNRAGEYWGQVEERAARLLENYIYNELKRKNEVSPLLVRKDTLFNEEELPEEDYVKSAWPYPSARENEEIKPYFDHLFSTLEEKVDEQGNVILFRSPIFGLQTQFANLQSEYDALDKDDEQALNAWRDKKADVVRSYVNWVSDKFGLKCELYVFNGGREDEMRKAYDTMVERYEAKGIKRIPSYESFKEKVANPKVVATHRKSINFVTFNTSAKDAELDIEQFAETLFHENAHRIAQGMYSKQEFEQIWENANKSKNHIAKSVGKLYSDKSDAQKGNEFVAKAIGELVRNHKQLFTKFLMGKNDISAEDLVKKLKYSLPLGKLALTETLNKFKDEYQERVLQGSGNSLLGGSRDGGNIEVSEGDGGRNSRRNRQRESERLRAERGRDVVEAATKLASSLGVKLNVIEDVNEITDSNARRQRAKRGAKAWYDVKADQVYFVAPNATSIADAQESVLHEVVAHKGLRDVVGRENFNRFLDKVFQSATPEIRSQIVRLAAQNGWDIREATEEYLASLAEQGFDSRENRTFWQKVRDLFMDMLREAKIAIGYNITDNDMRYMLWRTYQMQKSQGAMAFAEDVLMQQKLGVGNFRTRPMTEEEQIIADAKANGTYLKAPNGNDTNLTPKQWAQVRTKAFKKWFGDWEKAARIEKLRKSKDAEITGNEIEASEDLKKYKKNAQMYGRTLQGEYTNVDTGAIISLQRGRHNGGINEVLQHNYKDVAHLQSVAAIPQIIENGIYIESQPNKDTDTNPDVKEHQMFVCGLKIGGEDYTVLAKVAVDSKGNRYYDHNLVSVEKGKLIDIANNEQSAVSSGFGTTPDTKSTTNSQRKYKELISLLQTNSSKVVDANGEPMVVYNGSKVQHYLYDGRLRTKGQSATNSKVSFFTDNKDVAERYGKFINEVFLNIRNPYEIDYNGAGWQGWSGAADGMQRASTDSYADLLANGSVDSTLERIIENYGRAEADYLASGSVRNEGVAPDGVIAYNVADPIRSTLYIVRNAEAKDISRNSVTPKGVETFTKLGKASLLFDSQIKSATDNVGTFDSNNDDIRFRIDKEGETATPSSNEPNSETVSKEEKFQKALKSLRKALKGKKSIRRALAALVASRVRHEVTDDIINVMGKSEFNALVKQVQEADIEADVVKPLERISEIVADLSIKDKEKKIFDLLALKVRGENQSGVSIAKSVDNATRKLFDILAGNIKRPADEIRNAFDGKVDDLILNMALDISEKYRQATSLMRESDDINAEIKTLKEENTALRKKRAELNKEGKTDEAKAISKQISKNKEIISALESERLVNKEQTEQMLSYVHRNLYYAAQMGRGLYKTLMYHNMMHKVDMVNIAMRDVDTKQTLSVLTEKPSRREKAKENVRAFLLSPARSLNYLLKRITVNAPYGEGQLYDYFIRGKNGYIAAAEKFYNGYNEFKDELNNKTKSVFGKPYKEVLAESNNPSNATITVTAGSRVQDVQLTIGQAMYLYMVNKMADGKVKLAKMGIFDEDVERAKDSLPTKYIAFADWLQNEFLPEKREKYNETHIKIFGTDMASIDNYVPMKNKRDEVYQEFDGTKQDEDRLPTTITGSIINRKRNNVILDLTTNALDLMLTHGEEMEHWNAYTPVVRDMNELLSNTKFKLVLDNRSRGLTQDLKVAARIASGQYSPEVDRFSKAWAIASKGIVASKIAFRVWTAIKQMLSFPAFVAYSSSASYHKQLAKSLIHPIDAWKWGMDNLPILHKRWNSRSLGNEKLSEITESTLGKILDGTAKVGMIPNAFVDALTCAIGAKAVYDYKVKEYQAQMYSLEEAKYRALIDATVSFNESQQSNEGLFLSQIQSNRDGLSVMVSTFNNQTFGYLRKTLEAGRELMRRRDAEIEYLRDIYINQGMNYDDAERMAKVDVRKTKRTAVLTLSMYGFLLNTIWVAGSNVFKYIFDDDDDEELKNDMFAALAIAPVRNTTVGSWVESAAQGYDINPSILLSDLNTLKERLTADEPVRWDKTVAYMALKVASSMTTGVDLETLVRLYEGIDGMITDGVDVEDIMALISAPRSQALLTAREPKENETLPEYLNRIAKIERRIDSRISDSVRRVWVKNYYMYQLANEFNLSTKRDDFGRVSIPEYKNIIDEAKITSDREKSYSKNKIPESDMEAFKELPEYKRMEITKKYKKDIDKILRTLKGDITEDERAKQEKMLLDKMRNLLDELGLLSNK